MIISTMPQEQHTDTGTTIAIVIEMTVFGIGHIMTQEMKTLLNQLSNHRI